MDLYTLTLPLDATAGVTLRTWLADILDEHNGSREASRESAEIVLAAVEALNSALRNAAPQHASVVVTLSIVGRSVYVTVTERDKGRAVRALHGVGDEHDPSVATIGLTLMRGLVDQVDFYDADDGKVVRLVKRLRLPTRQHVMDAPRFGPALADSSRAV